MSKMRRCLLIKLKWLLELGGNTILACQQTGSWFPACTLQITLLLLSKSALRERICVCVFFCSSPSLFLSLSSSPSVNTYVCGKNTNSSCYLGSLWWSARKQKWKKTVSLWLFVDHSLWFQIQPPFFLCNTNSSCSSSREQWWYWIEAKIKVSLLSISSKTVVLRPVALCLCVYTCVFM